MSGRVDTQSSFYHMCLRMTALTCAFLLVFDSGLLSPVTKELSQNTQLYVANVVGMYAAVEETEINSITTQLSARSRELDEREAALTEREMSIGLNSANGEATLSTYLLSVILFILLVLIVLNYVLDFIRQRERRELQQV